MNVCCRRLLWFVVLFMARPATAAPAPSIMTAPAPESAAAPLVTDGDASSALAHEDAFADQPASLDSSPLALAPDGAGPAKLELLEDSLRTHRETLSQSMPIDLNRLLDLAPGELNEEKVAELSFLSPAFNSEEQQLWQEMLTNWSLAQLLAYQVSLDERDGEEGSPACDLSEEEPVMLSEERSAQAGQVSEDDLELIAWDGVDQPESKQEQVERELRSREQLQFGQSYREALRAEQVFGGVRELAIRDKPLWSTPGFDVPFLDALDVSGTDLGATGLFASKDLTKTDLFQFSTDNPFHALARYMRMSEKLTIALNWIRLTRDDKIAVQQKLAEQITEWAESFFAVVGVRPDLSDLLKWTTLALRILTNEQLGESRRKQPLFAIFPDETNPTLTIDQRFVESLDAYAFPLFQYRNEQWEFLWMRRSEAIWDAFGDGFTRYFPPEKALQGVVGKGKYRYADLVLLLKSAVIGVSSADAVRAAQLLKVPGNDNVADLKTADREITSSVPPWCRISMFESLAYLAAQAVEKKAISGPPAKMTEAEWITAMKPLFELLASILDRFDEQRDDIRFRFKQLDELRFPYKHARAQLEGGELTGESLEREYLAPTNLPTALRAHVDVFAGQLMNVLCEQNPFSNTQEPLWRYGIGEVLYTPKAGDTQPISIIGSEIDSARKGIRDFLSAMLIENGKVHLYDVMWVFGRILPVLAYSDANNRVSLAKEDIKLAARRAEFFNSLPASEKIDVIMLQKLIEAYRKRQLDKATTDKTDLFVSDSVGFVLGAGGSIWGTIKGFYKMVTRPGDTVKGIKMMCEDPELAFKALMYKAEIAYAESPGQATGYVWGEVLQLFLFNKMFVDPAVAIFNKAWTPAMRVVKAQAFAAKNAFMARASDAEKIAAAQLVLDIWKALEAGSVPAAKGAKIVVNGLKAYATKSKELFIKSIRSTAGQSQLVNEFAVISAQIQLQLLKVLVVVLTDPKKVITGPVEMIQNRMKVQALYKEIAVAMIELNREQRRKKLLDLVKGNPEEEALVETINEAYKTLAEIEQATVAAYKALPAR